MSGTLRRRMARQLRFIADCIDQRSGPRALGYSFTIEAGRIVFHDRGDIGCPIWHMADDYYKAFDWETRRTET